MRRTGERETGVEARNAMPSQRRGGKDEGKNEKGEGRQDNEDADGRGRRPGLGVLRGILEHLEHFGGLVHLGVYFFLGRFCSFPASLSSPKSSPPRPSRSPSLFPLEGCGLVDETGAGVDGRRWRADSKAQVGKGR